MILRLAILALLAATASAQLADCPAVASVSGFEQGFSLDVPASLVDADVSAAQVVLTTRTGTSRAAIVTALDALASDANPERRVKLLDTAGSAIAFCRSSITVNSSSELTMGFKLDLDADDGGRACLYIDTDQSESSDLSDCSTSGGYSGWAFFHLGGNLTDLSGNSRTLTAPSDTPSTGTDGPLGHSAVIDSAGSEAYYEVSSSGGSGVLDSAQFTVFFAGAGDNGTANAGNNNLIWRDPADQNTTLSLRWNGGSSVWGHMVQPRQGVSSGWTEFGPIDAATDFAVVCVRESNVEMRCFRAGAGLVETKPLVSTTVTASTSNFFIGSDNAGNTWDGEFHAVGFTTAAAWTAARAKVLSEIAIDQDDWTVTALSTASPTRRFARRRVVYLPAWVAVAAASCGPGEIQSGIACIPDAGGEESSVGAMDILTGGLFQ